jgi:hypothetical protein
LDRAIVQRGRDCIRQNALRFPPLLLAIKMDATRFIGLRFLKCYAAASLSGFAISSRTAASLMESG